MNQIYLDNGREISETSRPFFIGEIGINHNGEMSIAKELIDMAADVGIDSVKFQLRDYHRTISPEMLNMPYENINSFGETYLAHKEYLEFSKVEIIELFEYSRKMGLVPCCSGFDIGTYDFIQNHLNPLFHKIPSPLTVNHDLLKKVAEYGKPIFLSTGMTTSDEIDMAVGVILDKNPHLVLMQCTSLYPTQNNEVDLNVIKDFSRRYSLVTGFSSHDKSVVFPAAAHAMGAAVIEKHITLDRTMKGPDHLSSFEKRGLDLAYNYLITTHDALGNTTKSIQEREYVSREKHMQSIVSTRDIECGERIRSEDIEFKSPGTGLLPYKKNEILDKEARVFIKKGQIITQVSLK
jgi:sialic acid synthase